MHRRPGQSSCARAALDTFTSVRLFQIEGKNKKKSTYVHTHTHTHTFKFSHHIHTLIIHLCKSALLTYLSFFFFKFYLKHSTFLLKL